MPRSALNAWSFFMLGLPCRIRPHNRRLRFNQAKTPLPGKPTQLHSISLFNERPPHFAIAEIPIQAKTRRLLMQGILNFGNLLRIQSSGMFPLLQAGQLVLLKVVHPIFHPSRCIAQQSADLVATHSLSYQKHPTQSVALTGFGALPNLILQHKKNHRCIRKRQRFHELTIVVLPYSKKLMSVGIAGH